MASVKKVHKTAKSTQPTTRIEKRQLSEAELDRVAGGDNYGNIV